MATGSIELRSEFARVRVALDTSAKGPRLLIEDMKTGSRLFVDPLELESIATATHEDLTYLLHPSRRWQV
ncbi:MAG: hypothetical protein AAB289_13275 [Chloroflexota bacterium]